MSAPYVTVERGGPVATVKFDRGKNLNAFDAQLVLELTDVARSFHDDLETRAVVLTGNRDYFSAGADMGDLNARDDSTVSEVEKRHVFSRGVRLCAAWEAMPQVTVAAMERLAVGAGVALPLACDWRVLGENAYLWVPEIKIGVHLQWGALPRLINLVGPARAKRICILCEKMDARQALAWGLIDEIAKDGQVLEKAAELAERAAEMPPLAVRILKEAVNATATALNRTASYADSDQSRLAAASADSKSARRQFKKKP